MGWTVWDNLNDVHQYNTGVAGEKLLYLPALVNTGFAVNSQPAAVAEIYKQATDMRVFKDVPQAHECAISIHIWKRETSWVDELDNAWATALKRTVAVPRLTAGGHKEKGHAL